GVGPNFSITKHTKVCSLHFRKEEIKTGPGGKKMDLAKDAIPSKFAWRTSPRKRLPPFNRTSELIPEKRKPSTTATEGRLTCTADAVSNELHIAESQESLKVHLLQSQQEIARLNEEVSNLKTRLATVEAELMKSKEEIKRRSEENSTLKSYRFCINNLSENDSISFYTGFPNIETFQATLSYLNPGESGENIRYWRSVEIKVDENFYEENNKKKNYYNKPGRRRTLKAVEEFFLVMCRLRQGFHKKHLSFLFGISQPTVSRIFISCIHFMFLRFGTINIWPSRKEVNKTTPEDFKVKYPKTHVTRGCGENTSYWCFTYQYQKLPYLGQSYTCLYFLSLIKCGQSALSCVMSRTPLYLNNT
ncbi:hypothetical protein P5673_030995, partial [Acropora cervicornis]